jgi:hypothetical protein
MSKSTALIFRNELILPMVAVVKPAVIEQVALNKSSLLLPKISQNTQTLKLFQMIIKTESIY